MAASLDSLPMEVIPNVGEILFDVSNRNYWNCVLPFSNTSRRYRAILLPQVCRNLEIIAHSTNQLRRDLRCLEDTLEAYNVISCPRSMTIVLMDPLELSNPNGEDRFNLDLVIEFMMKLPKLHTIEVSLSSYTCLLSYFARSLEQWKGCSGMLHEIGPSDEYVRWSDLPDSKQL